MLQWPKAIISGKLQPQGHRDRRESFCSENKNFPQYTVCATGNSTLPPCPLPHCFLGSTSEPLQQFRFSFKQQPLTVAFGAASPNPVPFTQQDSFKPLKEEENTTSSQPHPIPKSNTAIFSSCLFK